MDLLDDILDEKKNKEYELKYGLDFKTKFKIIDTRQGFHVVFSYLFKRGLSPQEINFLENEFFKNTIDVNNVSGLELSDFNMNRQYTAFFTLYYYEDGSYDFFLHHTVK